MLQEKKIYVYFDNNVDKRIKVGCLYVDFQKGKEKFSFEYDDEFFTSFLFRNFFDYDLQPYKARQYLPTDKTLFGVFSDTPIPISQSVSTLCRSYIRCAIASPGSVSVI